MGGDLSIWRRREERFLFSVVLAPLAPACSPVKRPEQTFWVGLASFQRTRPVLLDDLGFGWFVRFVGKLLIHLRHKKGAYSRHA
jgi:hypothetical protein